VIKKVLTLFFQALSDRMASNACYAAFAASEDVPILHYYGFEVLALAKRIMISQLLLKADKMDVEEFLKGTFTNKKQVILAPYYGGESFSLDDIPFEQLEEICIFKPTSEPSPIVGDHNHDAFNALRVHYANACADGNGERKASTLEDVRNFVFKAVLENLAASIHKEFASYFNPIQKQQLLLLGNRKTYTTDKNKIQRAEQNIKKNEAAKKRTEARAALPSTSTKLASKSQDLSINSTSQDQSELKSNQIPAAKSSNPKDGASSNKPNKRKSRKNINYKETSGDSSSSVEYPVEGKHTDDESDHSDSGNKTPILFQQTPFPAFMTAPAAAMQSSTGPLNFDSHSTKHKRKSSKHSKRPLSPVDLDSKPSSTKEKKRLDKKKSSRKSSKKAAKRSKKYSSSSSDYSSSSESDSAPSEQVSISFFVSPFPFIHNLLSIQ